MREMIDRWQTSIIVTETPDHYGGQTSRSLEMNTKNKFLQWLFSTWFAQLIGYIFIGGWCYIRLNDRRFVGVSKGLHYERDPLVPSHEHRPSKWNTWVCIRVPTSYYSAVEIVFDTYTGQRLALLKKKFQGGDLVAFRVGPEDAEVGFLSRDLAILSHPPEFICRWTQTAGDGHVPQEFWHKLDGKKSLGGVNYI